MGDDLLAAARIVLLQEECQAEHGTGGHRQKPEGVDVGKSGSLYLKCSINLPVSMSERIVRTKSALPQLFREPIYRAAEGRVARCNIAADPLLVELVAPRQHSGDHGSSHTRANVAHEVHQTGNGVVLLLGHAVISSGGGRDKDQA